MARVALAKPERVDDDPVIRGILEWVTQAEGAVPNHFWVEMNFPELFKAKLSCTRVLWEMGELSLQEIQYVGIAVSKANGCPYCTAAFCTILNHGLGTDEQKVKDFVLQLQDSLDDHRLKTIVSFALKFNASAKSITDADIASLREAGLTDKGIVQLCHLVSDFASYNRLNLALATDYDYRELWRQLAFGAAGATAAD